MISQQLSPLLAILLTPIPLDAGVVFWSDRGANQMKRMEFDGSGLQTIILSGEVDRIGGKLYWGDFSGGMIYRSNLDGSAREPLLSGNNSTRGVRIDFKGKIYWINRNDKKVHRVPLSALGGGVAIPLTHPAVQALYDNLDTPHGMTIDIPARKIYWADTGSNAGEGQGGSAVSRGDLDGSIPMEILASGTQPWDVELDRRCRNYDEWCRRAGTTDLTCWIEVSTNLIDWQGSLADPATVEVMVNPLENGMEEVTVRGLVPVPESPISCMRVVVELLPGG